MTQKSFFVPHLTSLRIMCYLEECLHRGQILSDLTAESASWYEIKNKLSLSDGNCSILVRRLHKQGYIAKYNNGRQTRFFITNEGKEVLDTLRTILNHKPTLITEEGIRYA